MTPKVYIAGPMTGIEDYNFPAFNRAAAEWRRAGWEVVNPAELDATDVDANGNATQPWDYYLRRDIKVLVDCHAIATLPGWRNSNGAKLEVYIADKLGMRQFDATYVAPPPPTHEFTGMDGNNSCCILPDYAHFDYWLGRRAA